MPIIANTNLPAFDRIRAQGYEVLTPERAKQQDIRAIHIGLLNMMPDAALEATERQFLRLMAGSNRIVQIHVHLFSPAEIQRGEIARAHCDAHYTSFEAIQTEGLDGLIITGANPIHKNLEDEAYWKPLCEVSDWAAQYVTSTFCSCLATHGLLKHRYGIERVPLQEKYWGVYDHRVVNTTHPITRIINSRQGIVHSRWNTIARDDFDRHGLRVLIESDEVGVHLATSRDGIRFIYSQGHPEYDTYSLLKEYKREIIRWMSNERGDYPGLPLNYLSAQSAAVLEEFAERMIRDKSTEVLAQFPEALISERIENSWRDSARAFASQWIGMIYQLTHADRLQPFMDGVDPQNPLGLVD